MHFEDLNGRVTILPELADRRHTDQKAAHLREFQAPARVREVSLVTHQTYRKDRLVNVLAGEIQNTVPSEILSAGVRTIVQITTTY